MSVTVILYNGGLHHKSFNRLSNFMFLKPSTPTLYTKYPSSLRRAHSVTLAPAALALNLTASALPYAWFPRIVKVANFAAYTPGSMVYKLVLLIGFVI